MRKCIGFSKARSIDQRLKGYLERKIAYEDREYPPPVLYRINEKSRFLFTFADRVGHASGELFAALNETDKQPEYLEALTDYFQNGISSLLKYRKEQNSLTIQDLDFMVRAFMRPIETSVKTFLVRFGQNNEKGAKDFP